MMDRRNRMHSATGLRTEVSAGGRPWILTDIVLALVLSIFCLACVGGSGSSGFDISPSAENESINAALVSRECVPGEELTICPANETALDVPATGMTPGPEDVDVSTIVDPVGAAQCGAGGEQLCHIAVTVTVSGLPSGSAYQVAGRSATPLTSWVIDGEATMLSGDGATSFNATVVVPATSLSLQAAVLVFVDRSGTAAGEIRTLTETGASFAFVTTPVTIPR